MYAFTILCKTIGDTVKLLIFHSISIEHIICAKTEQTCKESLYFGSFGS